MLPAVGHLVMCAAAEGDSTETRDKPLSCVISCNYIGRTDRSLSDARHVTYGFDYINDDK